MLLHRTPAHLALPAALEPSDRSAYNGLLSNRSGMEDTRLVCGPPSRQKSPSLPLAFLIDWLMEAAPDRATRQARHNIFARFDLPGSRQAREPAADLGWFASAFATHPGFPPRD
jgi:hypothetical protein